MTSSFSARGFYQSGDRNRRTLASRNENDSPNGILSTPRQNRATNLFSTPPRSEVTNDQLYRSITTLSRTMENVLEEMKQVKAQQAELKEEVAYLRQRQETEPTRDEEFPEPQPSKRQKRAHLAPLSEKVRRLHNSEENDKKYKGELGLNDPHNEAVTSFLMKEVSAIPDTTYSEETIRNACVGYYETIRQRHLDSQPENQAKTTEKNHAKLLRSRRQRLLSSRTSVLQTEEERELWTGVSLDMMSDEENAEDDGKPVWLVKPPSYRSQELSDLCGVLQARLQRDRKHRLGRTTRKEEAGVYSTRRPPKEYNPERAALHFKPQHVPRYSTLTNNTTTPDRRAERNTTRAFQNLDNYPRQQSMEGFNEARFVEGGSEFSSLDNDGFMPL